MPWECLKCGSTYPEVKMCCEKCNISKEYAMNMDIKQKTTCPECNHPHRWGKFCHIFAEGFVDAMEDMEDGDDSLAADENDDDSLLGTSAKAAVEDTRRAQTAPLPTPVYVKRIGFIRCNCTHGVPENSRRYVPCPKRVLCGKIYVLTFDEIYMPEKKTAVVEEVKPEKSTDEDGEEDDSAVSNTSEFSKS